MSYAAPLSRLARSRARADPHPSPRPDIVILSISARFVPRNVAGRHTVQSVGQHRERRELGQRAFHRTAMRSKGFRARNAEF